MALSRRLGRSYSKEQYAYLYRPAKLTLLQVEVFNDVQDQFEREPYVALFQYKDGKYNRTSVIWPYIYLFIALSKLVLSPP